MLADHPVQRLVGGFSFSNKILLLSSPAHHGWLGLITYGYVGVKTGAHPFSMRLEPMFQSVANVHEMSSAVFTVSMGLQLTPVLARRVKRCACTGALMWWTSQRNPKICPTDESRDVRRVLIDSGHQHSLAVSLRTRQASPASLPGLSSSPGLQWPAAVSLVSEGQARPKVPGLPKSDSTSGRQRARRSGLTAEALPELQGLKGETSTDVNFICFFFCSFFFFLQGDDRGHNHQVIFWEAS